MHILATLLHIPTDVAKITEEFGTYFCKERLPGLWPVEVRATKCVKNKQSYVSDLNVGSYKCRQGMKSSNAERMKRKGKTIERPRDRTISHKGDEEEDEQDEQELAVIWKRMLRDSSKKPSVLLSDEESDEDTDSGDGGDGRGQEEEDVPYNKDMSHEQDEEEARLEDRTELDEGEDDQGALKEAKKAFRDRAGKKITGIRTHAAPLQTYLRPPWPLY